MAETKAARPRRGATPAGAAATLLLALVSSALPAAGEELGSREGYNLVLDVMNGKRAEARVAGRRLVEAADLSLVPALVDGVFFAPAANRPRVVKVLADLTGDEAGAGYFDWVEYLGGREDVRPKEGYLEWKRVMLSRIDPSYAKIFYDGAPARIRLEEIVWGGVPVDGIPVLERPPMVAADDPGARYLKGDELVFGLDLEGERRAYPRRFLSWHEMLFDVVGGRAVTLSYCTLCGSAILYDSGPADSPRTFGTSGLLYRSNKLMFDHQSYTLWSNLTGEPVVGRLAHREALAQLPLTLTTWEDWRRRHPDTMVVDRRGLESALGSDLRFRYEPGLADRARAGVEFPVWLESAELDRSDEVFALRLGGVAKAYPLERVLAERVINDTVGEERLVLVGDPESRSVRAYRRGEQTFSPAEGGRLAGAAGGLWEVTEPALVQVAGDQALERLPGHVAFWFGWYAFYPQTELYRGSTG